MKAFLSYSLTDDDQFVIPLLAKKLNEKGFFVSTGSYKTTREIDLYTQNEINTSNLFIGIITTTNTDTSNQRVFNEWQYSSGRKTPSLLLVEDTYNLHPELVESPAVVRFNRNNPSIAIELIKYKIEQSKQSNTLITDENAPWLLGGAALVILIALLAASNK